MSKRTVFTTITPLPVGVTRQIVLDFLHDHEEMIDLNPLVKERHPIPIPPHAHADEQHCQWYSLTDKISYLPGVAGDVTYTCAFNDLPTGIQTHCYAPAGLTIRDKWTVGGSLPGEPPQPIELGLRAPVAGLYLREDVDMRCNVIMTAFVKKTLKKSHAALVDRLKIKAEIASSNNSRARNNRHSNSSAASPKANPFTTSGSNAPSSISSQHYERASASDLTRRPSSVASSVATVASSVSSYSVQNSSMWSSPPASSLGTSPALSAMSPPTPYSGNYPSQPQPQPGEYAAQPRELFLSPQPANVPSPIPELPSITLPVQEPETPFLRKLQPDWPLKFSAPAPLRQNQQQQQQQQQPDWPFKKQRPQTQLFIQAYRPPLLSYPATTAATTTKPNNTGSSANANGSALPDDALWQALGGGQFMARNMAAYHASNGKGHARAKSYGAAHPEYPQMSPYDDENDVAVGAGVGVAGLGVGGMRRVSMPPPSLRMGGAAATLSGPFVARMN